MPEQSEVNPEQDLLPPKPRQQALVMGPCYSLGAFNDTFFKQTALLLAATAGLTGLQGWTTFLFALPFVLFSLYSLSGVCGGLYLIPLTSFAQVRPLPKEKGRILGASNFMTFTAILLAGQIFPLLALLPPSMGHAVTGIGTGLVAWLFAKNLRRLCLQNIQWQDIQHQGASLLGRCALAFIRGILSLRYRVRVEGIDSVLKNTRPDRPILFLPNHPAFVDPLIVYTALAPDFLPRPLGDRDILSHPMVRTLIKLVRPVLIPDLGSGGRKDRAGVLAALQELIEALRKGENIMLYPAGGLSRDGFEKLGNKSAVHTLLQAVPESQVVLVRTQGLWGSSFGWRGGQPPKFQNAIRRGAQDLLWHGIFFMPRREVCLILHLAPDIALLAASNDSRTLNRHLEAFYNQEKSKESHFTTLT